MSDSSNRQENHDHTRSIILAATIVSMTCILSCAAIMIVLIMRIP